LIFERKTGFWLRKEPRELVRRASWDCVEIPKGEETNLRGVRDEGGETTKKDG
jgi:hypothetical protein